MEAKETTPQRPFPPHVKNALSNGELWRAKEILQGTIASSKYDPLLCEQYGLVLLQMHDSIEAGKYLFLSGQEKEEYQAAIALYFKKYGRRDWQNLVTSFPKRAKNIKFDLFPEAVRRELTSLEMTQNRGEESPAELPDIQMNKYFDKYFDAIITIGCSCVGLFITACFALGLAVVMEKIISWFR